jgi:hypothetical protein
MAGKVTRCPSDTGLDETIEQALTSAATSSNKAVAFTQARAAFMADYTPSIPKSQADIQTCRTELDRMLNPRDEQRFNQCHDPHSGEFCSGGGGGTGSAGGVEAGGAAIVPKDRPVMRPGSGEASVEKSLPGRHVETRYVTATTKDGRERLTKSGQPMLDKKAMWEAHPDIDSTMRDNARDALLGTPEWAKGAANDWYPELGGWTHDQAVMPDARRNDGPLTDVQAASVVAAYSGNSVWAGNVSNSQRFIRNDPTISHTDMHYANAVKASSAPDPVQYFRDTPSGSPKFRDFTICISGGDTTVVDRWGARIVLHTDDNDYAAAMLSAPGGYDRIQAALRLGGADAIGGRGIQLNTQKARQAAPWIFLNPEARAPIPDRFE